MRIAISGAGVAGTALAYWLHRTGPTPTLIEQAPAFRTGGYMIDFWGVGYQVAKRMGIEDQLCAAGYQIEHLRSVDSDGAVKADFHVGAVRGLIGDDFTSLSRGDLAEAIYRTVEGKVESIFGDSISAVEDHGDGVRVTFEHSAPRDFDLLVGADGLHSNVRRLVFGPEQVVEHYLEPLAVAGVDTLILGCTHYPLLADVIRSVAARVLSPEVQVVDSAHATASELHALLHARGLARADGPGTLRIMVTDLPGRFAEVAGRFLGRDIDAAAVEQIDL